jgi:glycosyltransferase involved in cell wall biosynthesis
MDVVSDFRPLREFFTTSVYRIWRKPETAGNVLLYEREPTGGTAGGVACQLPSLAANATPVTRRPGVSVLVPCRNEVVTIEACLRSILAQESPPGGFEVIVADGMSDDGTRSTLARVVASDERIRLIDNPGRIASTGLNAAIRIAQGSIFVRMDAHCLYAPDYLRRCVEALDRTGADNVGGPYRTWAEKPAERAIAAASKSTFAVGSQRARQIQYEGYTDTVVFGCWRREAFDRFGPFDETLVRNQDDEHNRRIIGAGGKIWQSPAIRAWCRPRSSLHALFRQYFAYGYWKVPVIVKHRGPASARHLVPAAFVLSIVSLPELAFCWTPALRLWIGLVVIYAAGVLGASVVAAARGGWDLLPRLPATFCVFHLAYGLGFLAGLIRSRWHR